MLLKWRRAVPDAGWERETQPNNAPWKKYAACCPCWKGPTTHCLGYLAFRKESEVLDKLQLRGRRKKKSVWSCLSQLDCGWLSVSTTCLLFHGHGNESTHSLFSSPIWIRKTVNCTPNSTCLLVDGLFNLSALRFVCSLGVFLFAVLQYRHASTLELWDAHFRNWN